MGVKIRLVVVNGNIQAFVENGTFEEAAPALTKLLAELGAQGIKFDSVSQVEQHKHDSEGVRNDVRAD